MMMRPLATLLLAGCMAVVLALLPGTTFAHPGDDTVIAAGQRALNGLLVNEELCGPNGYQIEGTDLCTHDADPPPSDEELEHAELALDNESASIDTICTLDGTSGKRVQVLYVRPSDQPDRYATKLSQIRTIAANLSQMVDASARLTGGRRLVHYLTTREPICAIDVQHVEIPADADDTFSATIKALKALGYDSPDRKYLLFMESNVYCGIATTVNDDRPGDENYSNHRPGYARVDQNCWNEVAAAHELMHTLGAVQHAAPNSTGGWHCTDQYDVMCYSDAPYYPAVSTICADGRYGDLLDCNSDDYFHTHPPAGSYLATHWNVANSQFLYNLDRIGKHSIALTVTLTTTPNEYLVKVNINGDEQYAALFTQVDFYEGDHLLASQTGGGFEMLWQPAAPGEYRIRAQTHVVTGSLVMQELRVKVSEEKRAVYLPMIRLN